MNSKHSLVFFSAGVAFILILFLMGVPMNIIPESKQNQTIESNLLVQQQDTDITKLVQKKSIEEMNCIELKEFAMSFEKGWGNAVASHDERCS